MNKIGVEIELIHDDIDLDSDGVYFDDGEFIDEDYLPATVPLGFNAKYDSSIDADGYNGAEFVLEQPVSFEESKELFPKIIEKLRIDGYEAHETCGIHFHIDKDEFNPVSFYKMYTLINTPEFEVVLEKFAGRGSAEFATTKPEGLLFDVAYKFQKMAWRNLMPTVELRMFASTTNPETMSRYLDFIDVLLMFSKYNGNSTIDAFSTFLGYRTYMGFYEEIYNFIEEKRLCVL